MSFFEICLFDFLFDFFLKPPHTESLKNLKPKQNLCFFTGKEQMKCPKMYEAFLILSP